MAKFQDSLTNSVNLQTGGVQELQQQQSYHGLQKWLSPNLTFVNNPKVEQCILLNIPLNIQGGGLVQLIMQVKTIEKGFKYNVNSKK